MPTSVIVKLMSKVVIVLTVQEKFAYKNVEELLKWIDETVG